MSTTYDISVEELDDTYEQSLQPENIKITLWTHQLTLLNRCKSYENQNLLLHEFDSLRETHPNITSTDYLRTQVGIIGDSVGSGKSYVILALIKENDITNLGSTVKSYGHNKVVFCYNERNINLKTNLLVVPHNLISQWEKYITTFSDDLKYMIVSKSQHVNTLNEMTTTINDYNLIVVTSTYYSNVAHFLTSRSFKMQRIIYDEIDNMNLPNCTLIESNFYWFVTASFGNLLYPRGYSKVDSRLNRHVYYANGIKNSGFVKETFLDLFNHLSREMVKLIVLKNRDSFIQSSVLLPSIIENHVLCKTPIAINILDGFVDREVIQSLNAGDLAAALQRVSPNNRTKEDNIVAIQIEKYTKELENYRVRIETTNSLHYDTEEQKDAELNRLRNKKQEYQNRIDGIIERIKNTDTCSICFDDINRKTISPCCSNSFCFLCINIWLTKNSKCPMCKQDIVLNNLLVVDEENTQWNPLSEQDVNIGFDKIKNLEIILRQRAHAGKILIYSSYDMSFPDLTGILHKLNLKYAFLKGQEAQIRRTIDRYKNEDLNVLLVNARSYGAGLNLENTTDVIMFHRMESESEKQIIGRAQRWPRNTQLNVHYLLYDNEMRKPNISDIR